MAVEAAVAKRLTNLDAASQVFVFVQCINTDFNGSTNKNKVTVRRESQRAGQTLGCGVV